MVRGLNDLSTFAITVSERASLFQRLRYRSGLPKCSYVIHVRYVHRLDKEHLVHSHESSNLTPQCAGAGRQRWFAANHQMLFVQSVHITYMNDISAFGQSPAITESRKKRYPFGNSNRISHKAPKTTRKEKARAEKKEEKEETDSSASAVLCGDGPARGQTGH